MIRSVALAGLALTSSASAVVSALLSLEEGRTLQAVSLFAFCWVPLMMGFGWVRDRLPQPRAGGEQWAELVNPLSSTWIVTMYCSLAVGVLFGLAAIITLVFGYVSGALQHVALATAFGPNAWVMNRWRKRASELPRV